ncbi:MAG: 4-hydroxy-tetrahydrodipicolinate reductase [Nitrospirota bacterium]|nr:4-hydroxy-tetrahydrodipicolinate reductase [Nitrospirota bacterium]MDH5767776.1 4-hydroxy-tetrahydrodipicolinate reductase [Nitrospirota bacterium]
MIKIAVAGAAGRMGSRITVLSKEYEGLQLTGAFEKKGHKDIGRDIGTVVGIGDTGVKLVDSLDSVIDNADMIISFTTVEASLEHLRFASSKGKAMVIGTTGFSKDHLKEVAELTKKIPCVMASNMSMGVNLLLKVLQDIARVLGDDYDIEIIEAHHRLKKDAPSGTALKIAQVISGAINRNLEEVAVYARKGLIGERTRKEIGIQTIRAGDIVGEHTVIFGGLGERIEITHKASSRDTFARGALKAALWLSGRPAGLYDMQDVLGLK